MTIEVIPRSMFEFDTVEHYIGDGIECFGADEWDFISNLSVYPEYCTVNDYPCYIGEIDKGIYEFNGRMYVFESGVLCIMPMELLCKNFSRIEVMESIGKDDFGWVVDYKDSKIELLERL
jgi:hypothetical protein